MSTFDQNRWDIQYALELGIMAEGQDGNPLEYLVKSLTAEQVDWISSWLAGEGIGRIIK